VLKDTKSGIPGSDAVTPDIRLQTITAYIEPSLAQAKAGDKFQFKRHGYFVAVRVDHRARKAVFNLVTGLKDNWAK
jgi:glutaminyl-tRNA synthetase